MKSLNRYERVSRLAHTFLALPAHVRAYARACEALLADIFFREVPPKIAAAALCKRAATLPTCLPALVGSCELRRRMVGQRDLGKLEMGRRGISSTGGPGGVCSAASRTTRCSAQCSRRLARVSASLSVPSCGGATHRVLSCQADPTKPMRGVFTAMPACGCASRCAGP